MKVEPLINISYLMGLNFYKKAIVKDILAFLPLIVKKLFR